MADSPGTIHVPPRQPLRPLKAPTILVRVRGKLDAARVFADAEVDEARQYAAEQGGTCEPLPVSDGVWDWETGRWIGRQ
jgi:hypothetical protein